MEAKRTEKLNSASAEDPHQFTRCNNLTVKLVNTKLINEIKLHFRVGVHYVRAHRLKYLEHPGKLQFERIDSC